MNRRALDTFRAETEFRTLLGQIRDYFQRGPNLDRKILMALQSDVQKLVDDIRQNHDLVASIRQALEGQSKQITDLQATVQGLQSGQVLGPDELAAIQSGVQQLEEINTELQTAVPANTPGQPTAAPSGTLDDKGQPVPPNTANQPAETQPDTPATNPPA